MSGKKVFILAGGQSSRMQQDKALLPWENETLLASTVLRLSSEGWEVVVISANPNHADARWQCVPDIYPNAGPAGGIDTALQMSPNEAFLVFSVDMPFVHSNGLDALLTVATNNSMSIFSCQEKPMIFPMCLHGSLASAWRKLFLQNTRKLHDFVRAFHPIFVPGEDLEKATPPFFFNVNTPDDYQQALAWKTSNFN
ncbi:MAG: molybdenum cofactor guanylyltransferase [Chitinophagaceae bacterium]